MPWLRDSWTWIKEHKKGIFFGAIFGAGTYLFGSATGTPVFSVAAPSLSDQVFQIGIQWKYLIGLVLAGAGLGAIVQNLARSWK